MKIWKEKIDGKTYWFADFTKHGTRYRLKEESKDELDEVIESINSRAPAKKYGLHVEQEVITLGQLVDAYTEDLDGNKKHHRYRKTLLEKLVEHLGKDKPVQSLSTADMKSFARARRLENRKLQSSSRNKDFDAINVTFHRAGDYFAELESWKSPRLPFEPVPEQGRERLITEEEQARIFFHLRAPQGFIETKRGRWSESPQTVKVRHTVADLFEFAHLTGVRHTEGRRLERSKVDFTIRTYDEVTTYGEVNLTKTKTGRKRRVPLNQDAAELLKRRLSETDSPWVFPNAEETAAISDTTVYNVLRRAALKAGVPYGLRTPDGFIFHDSRHTAVTGMIRHGADLKTVGSIVGHTDETMTMRYSHATERSRASAVTGLKRAKTEGSADKKPSKGNE